MKASMPAPDSDTLTTQRPGSAVPPVQIVTGSPAPHADTPEKPVSEPALLSLARVAVDARGLALAILAAVAFLYALQWAHKFLIPLCFSILIAYTLNPLVLWLERVRIPRIVGASLVMLTIVFGAAAAANTLHSQFQSILDGLPEATQKISRALRQSGEGQPSAIQKMQRAAAEIEKATTQAAGGKPLAGKAPVAEASTFKVTDWVWAGSMGAVEFIGQVTMVLFLVYFLLLAGDTFKRKLVKLTGPTLSQKKITVHILDDINTSIQNYMFMLLVTNILLAALMWGALRAIGLENAGAWAVAAGFLHIIPYFGPLLITIATGLTAFLQFGSPSTALMAGGASLLIATIVGTFVTTWMTGRIAKMNPAAVFIGLLFWGWIWGIWGLLLGIPIIVVIKVIAQHIEGMQSLAELLGE
ncbi:MAG: permease [Herminiimonas sp.]|nr:permease [Herminiimonas sp.]